MKKAILFSLISSLCSGQVILPEGTKVKVRLEHSLSSSTAQEGQSVDFTVSEDVMEGDTVVIPQGSKATGSIVETQAKRRMGRAGKLDFSVDKVRVADGRYVPVRYTPERRKGDSHALRTGLITAAVAYAFFPAAPLVLLMKGKDVQIPRGAAFDVFTDKDHTLNVAKSQVSAPVGTKTPVAFASATLQISILNWLCFPGSSYLHPPQTESCLKRTCPTTSDLRQT